MEKPRGFTIVEILVVCAVIGILFTIVSVAWALTLRESEDDTRFAEQQEWVSRFQTYRAQNGIYPDLPVNSRHCLGIDFPENQCGNSITATSASSNPALQALSKVGTLPEYQHRAVNGYVGPWVTYTPSNQINIYQSYHNGPCPSGTSHDTTFSEGVVCYITLAK